jgi:hypothetical protein
VKNINAVPAADVVEIVRCKDCKHYPLNPEQHTFRLKWPDCVCPCQSADPYYSWVPKPDWFCKDGERRNDE